MFDKKTRIEVPLLDTRPKVIDRPGGCRSLSYDVDHLLKVHPCFIGVKEGFDYTDHGPRDENLVAHLRVLTFSRGSHIGDVFTHQLEDRQNRFEVRFLSSYHDSQGSVFGTGISTRNRGIQALNGTVLALGGNILSQGGGRGSHINYI